MHASKVVDLHCEWNLGRWESFTNAGDRVSDMVNRWMDPGWDAWNISPQLVTRLMAGWVCLREGEQARDEWSPVHSLTVTLLQAMEVDLGPLHSFVQ